MDNLHNYTLICYREPIYLSPKLREDFQKHLLLFYTGIQRPSNPILSEQKENIDSKFEHLKKLSDLVSVFRKNLEKGDFKKVGEILHQNWLIKKELSSGISNLQIEEMYGLALKAGAWGGKILGAGGGGFLLIMASPERHEIIKEVLNNYLTSTYPTRHTIYLNHHKML